MLRRTYALTSIAFALSTLAPTDAVAAFVPTQRTFVASHGNDANPCSLALPCRGFAAAIAQTLSGGEVIVKDSAGYGIVTVTKSVSIIAPAGVYAGISVFPGNTGVTINAPGARVLLRGLTINGLGGTHGIVFQSGAELVIDRCAIANMASTGIHVTAPGSVLAVSDSVVREATSGPGVWLQSNVRATFQRVRVLGTGTIYDLHAHAVVVEASARLLLVNSVVSLNWGDGVRVVPAAGSSTEVTINDSLISDNAYSALRVYFAPIGASAAVSVSGTTITRSAEGIFVTVASGTATVTSSRNLIARHPNVGIWVEDASHFVSASENTFAGNEWGALSGYIHTVRGADGLPSNAGVESEPNSGAIVPVSPF